MSIGKKWKEIIDVTDRINYSFHVSFSALMTFLISSLIDDDYRFVVAVCLPVLNSRFCCRMTRKVSLRRLDIVCELCP